VKLGHPGTDDVQRSLSQSFFSFAHRAIDLGPSAPEMMAAMEIAMMFSTG